MRLELGRLGMRLKLGRHGKALHCVRIIQCMFDSCCRRLSSFDATCSFVMTLQLLSTVKIGIPCLGEYGIYLLAHKHTQTQPTQHTCTHTTHTTHNTQHTHTHRKPAHTQHTHTAQHTHTHTNTYRHKHTTQHAHTLNSIHTHNTHIHTSVQCGQQVLMLLCKFLLTLEPTEGSLPSLEAALLLLLTLCEASNTSRNHVCKELRGMYLEPTVRGLAF